MIGLIIPPAEIKKLLQKTAEHVATNGLAFEKVLMEREQNKIEFSFLKTDSPFRPYYDHRVAEISKQMLQGMQHQEEKMQEKAVQEPKVVEKEEEHINQQQKFLKDIFEAELKEPDPQKYVAELPEKLSEGDQAMIQHTAQYCAKNGKNFLVALSERQKNNPQFQFLRPASKNYPYFLSLVQAYTNILQQSQQDQNQLKQYAKSSETILNKCKKIFEYHMAKQQQARGKKEQTKQVKESNIDWNDFQLVETISFEYDTSKNIAGGELLQRIQQQQINTGKNLQEKIVSQPKAKEILQQCHICRQNILASEMNKHLKTCLGQKKKNVVSQVAQGQEVDIRRHLDSLSAKRPDIFGAKDHRITLREDEREKEEKIAFDGQAANLNRSTGSYAMLLHQQKKINQELQKGKK